MADLSGWISELFSSPASDSLAPTSTVSDIIGNVTSGASDYAPLLMSDNPNPGGGWGDSLLTYLGNSPSAEAAAPVSDYWASSAEAAADRPWYQDNPMTDSSGLSGATASTAAQIQNAYPNGFMDQLDKYAKMMDRPGVKTGASLGMGALSMWDAMKRNKMDKAAREAQAQALAARQAKAQQYDAPLRLTMNRQAVAKPQARRGESLFFTGNKLPAYAHGGSTPHYVRGGDTGQSDKIDAKVSPGEYIFDADSVSSLGDGNNEAGAAKLDQMRQNIRTHKRAAPSNKIPPKAKSPLAYMKGVK